MLFELVYKLISRLHSWLLHISNERYKQRKLKAFPPGCRVLLGGCPCVEGHVGKLGTVEGLDSFDCDYRVYPDGYVWNTPDSPTIDGTKKYELICAKGMKLVTK